jgi:hypothetical protein
MRKKILILAAAVLLPAMMFAADAAIGKDSQAYTDIKALVDANVITLALDKEQLARKEAVAYISDGVQNAKSKGLEDTAQLELLFGLVKSFQTDMMEQGKKLSDVQQDMIDLKVMQERVNLKQMQEKQDSLLSNIGARINGETTAYMTDLLLYGNGNNARYRPITQYIDFTFSAHSGTLLTAEAVLRLENIYGGFWGDGDFFGVRRLSVTGNFPVYFTLGSYNAKLTPLTVWANEDERPYEAKLYKDKRDMNKKELYLGDNAWPVNGVKAGYKGLFFGAAIEAEAFGTRLESAGGKSNPVSPGLATTTAQGLLTYNYDQYMWGGRIASDFTLKDMLKVGGNFTQIKDITDTGSMPNNNEMDNYVVSADAELKLFGIAKASAEYAISDYCVKNRTMPEVWKNKYISDTALNVKAEATYMDTTIEGRFFVVGNSFTAYAAQSRIYDESNNYPYLTQNNTWNSSLAIPTYMLANAAYPFTKYNNRISTNWFPVAHNMMPYQYEENSVSPYGDATANRQGYSARLSGKYLDGMLQPSARYTYATEIVSYLPGNQFTCPREFIVAEGGIKVTAFGAVLTGGYRHEWTSNDYTWGSVDMRSTVIDAGIEYTLLDRLTLCAGFKDKTYAGREFLQTYGGAGMIYGALAKFDMDIMSYGFGADLEITKQAFCGVSFTQTLINNKLNAASNYNAQEIDAKVGLKF